MARFKAESIHNISPEQRAKRKLLSGQLNNANAVDIAQGLSIKPAKKPKQDKTLRGQ
jgi:hypothetical protein